MAKVQRLMRPFVLRRLKADVLLALPEKTEEVVHVAMPPAQQAVCYIYVDRPPTYVV